MEGEIKMSHFIEVKDVEKKIDHFKLGPIQLSIEPGTITALVGDNGSGKSTLLKMIMNLVNYDAGTITVFNQPVHEDDEEWKKEVAYQPQTVIGYDGFTGNELNDLIAHWYPNWDQKLFVQLVDMFEIPLNRRFSALSQGVQQKLLLALTIPRNTKLLILDEPTSFMDIPAKNLLNDVLIEWMEKDERSIILASHQADDIQKLADYIVVIKNGKMLGQYEKEQLIESFRKFWLKPGSLNGKVPGEILRKENELISNDPMLTEKYFEENGIEPLSSANLELEEIITLLLTQR